MHAHQRQLGTLEITPGQHQVQVAMHMVLVTEQIELAELGLDAALCDALDAALGAHAVADQVADGAHAQAVLAREGLQLRTARHGAIVVHDFHDHCRRLHARQPRQIAARLGMPGAGKHAARLGHQWKDMARLRQVLGPRVLGHRGAHRVRTIIGRDAGGDAFGGLDRHGEIGAAVAIGFADHQRQPQLCATLAGERQADQAAPEARHEVDVLGPHLRGGHHQVALVLAVLIVHDHDHAPGGQVGQDVLDAIEGTAGLFDESGACAHGRDCSSRPDPRPVGRARACLAALPPTE
jgi:hypothetical protein